MKLNSLTGIVIHRAGCDVAMEVTSRFFERCVLGKTVRYKDVLKFKIHDLETSTGLGVFTVSKDSLKRFVPGAKITLITVMSDGFEYTKAMIRGEPLMEVQPAPFETLPKALQIQDMLFTCAKLKRDFGGDCPKILEMEERTTETLRKIEETRKEVGKALANYLRVPYRDNDAFYFRDGELPLLIKNQELSNCCHDTKRKGQKTND